VTLPHLFDLPFKLVHFSFSAADGRVVEDHWDAATATIGVRGLTDISTQELGAKFLALPECQMEPRITHVFLGPPPRPAVPVPTCWVLLALDGKATLVPIPRDEVARMAGVAVPAP
jgi:hypothetical protein